MSLMIHYFTQNGSKEVWIEDVDAADAYYFQSTDIKVSIEQLDDMTILYGCPYSDESEESEILVFATNKSCKDSLSELARLCKTTFTKIT